MASVHILDKSIYELIAAGEVIERPSSVVKELVENSIDAGATTVTVEIKKGGRTYIRVTDNGSGIAPDDIPKAFLRHATSKINAKEDLDAIFTLGFRGEALASICAVSKVEVLSKTCESDYGVAYQIDGGEEISYEESGCPMGTTIIVRDLFYNVPARLKFLKKDVSEGNSIAGVVSKLALSHPDISFKFIRDNRIDIVTPGDCKLISAVYAVMGSDFRGSVLPVDYSLNGVKVEGYITKPLLSRANRSFQNFFVNKRYVKSVTCMVALEEAYRNSIMTGKFPGCVLMLDIDPANIDVNVHPAKLEIRFSDEKPIYDAVYFGVKNALMINDAPMEAEISQKAERKPLTPEEIYKMPNPKPEQLVFASSPAAISTESIAKAPIPPIFSEPIKPAEPVEDTLDIENDAPDFGFKTLTSKNSGSADGKFVYKFIDSSKRAESGKSEAEPEPINESPVTVIGEVFKTYIIAQRDDEMYLIDKHAAHERYNFERLKSGDGYVDIQNILYPIVISLSYNGHAAACENQRMLKRFGFVFEPLKAPDIKLKGIPILLTDDDPADLLTEVTDRIASGMKGDIDGIFDELFHSVACKASVKANSDTPEEEQKKIVELVMKNNLKYCPHGRPILIKFKKSELEKLFKRTV